jgi:hypothetical protein
LASVSSFLSVSSSPRALLRSARGGGLRVGAGEFLLQRLDPTFELDRACALLVERQLGPGEFAFELEDAQLLVADLAVALADERFELGAAHGERLELRNALALLAQLRIAALHDAFELRHALDQRLEFAQASFVLLRALAGRVVELRVLRAGAFEVALRQLEQRAERLQLADARLESVDLRIGGQLELGGVRDRVVEAVTQTGQLAFELVLRRLQRLDLLHELGDARAAPRDFRQLFTRHAMVLALDVPQLRVGTAHAQAALGLLDRARHLPLRRAGLHQALLELVLHRIELRHQLHDRLLEALVDLVARLQRARHLALELVALLPATALLQRPRDEASDDEASGENQGEREGEDRHGGGERGVVAARRSALIGQRPPQSVARNAFPCASAAAALFTRAGGNRQRGAVLLQSASFGAA